MNSQGLRVIRGGLTGGRIFSFVDMTFDRIEDVAIEDPVERPTSAAKQLESIPHLVDTTLIDLVWDLSMSVTFSQTARFLRIFWTCAVRVATNLPFFLPDIFEWYSLV